MADMRNPVSLALGMPFLVLLLTLPGHAQQAAAIDTDPAPDPANPTAMVNFQMPSHGSMLNASVYVAAGPGPHPVVVFLHGFPGQEKNTDIAHAVVRAGWDALIFNYRGSWGSRGDFSFTHCLEDAQAAVDYMRDPANARRLRADPSRIVVLGHSMGGWMAAATLAADKDVRAAILVSGANMGARGVQIRALPDPQVGLRLGAAMMGPQVLGPLAGTTPAALTQELYENGAQWQFSAYAARMATRPVFFVTSDDGLAGPDDELAATLKKDGDKDVHTTHLATDHEYSGMRIALEQAVLTDLAALKLN
jgi:pimeloyl-ACP methyl ester carboxylesterase